MTNDPLRTSSDLIREARKARVDARSAMDRAEAWSKRLLAVATLSDHTGGHPLQPRKPKQ